MDDDVVEVRHHNFDLRRLEFNTTIDPFHIDKYAEAYTRLIGECITLLESFNDLKGEMASLRGEARFNRDEVNRLGVQITQLGKILYKIHYIFYGLRGYIFCRFQCVILMFF